MPTRTWRPTSASAPGTSIWHRAQVRDRRPDRPGLRDRPRRVHRRGRLARRPGQDPERRARLPRRHVADGVFIGPGRHPDQRSTPARRQPPPASLPGPPTGPSARSTSPRAPRSGPAPSSSPAATSGRSRWSGPVRVVTHDVPAHALVAGQPGARARLGLRLRPAPPSIRPATRPRPRASATPSTPSSPARPASAGTRSCGEEGTLQERRGTGRHPGSHDA